MKRKQKSRTVEKNKVVEKEYQKEYYQEHKVEKKEYYQEHQVEKKVYQTKYNKKNREIINSKQRVYDLKIKPQEFSKRYLKFKKAIKDGPTYVCDCCRRSLFKSGMFMPKLY